MSTPIREQIRAAVKTRLEAITTGNGYQQTVSDVIERTQFSAYSPRHLMVVLAQGPESDDEESPCGYEQKLATLYADLLCKLSDSSSVVVDTFVNTWWADVCKAVATDVTWGGLAIDTTVDARPRVDQNGSFEGARAEIAVKYRHTLGDPFSQ